jgi:hypothetical protein
MINLWSHALSNLNGRHDHKIIGNGIVNQISTNLTDFANTYNDYSFCTDQRIAR